MGRHINNRSNKPQDRSVLKSKLGMSLIEVLIALGMVGILASVIATVMQQMQKSQNQVNVINTIENMRINIQKLITDGTAWRATIENPSNAALVCVRTNALCTATPGTSTIQTNDNTTNATIESAPFLNLLRLEQASGGVYLDTTNPTRGFSNRGVPCTGWSATGNDDCPIQWRLKTALECQGTTPTCLNPTIRVIALLYYRAQGNSDQSFIINENKYRVDIRRGAKGDTRAERFSAEYSKTCGSTPCPTTTAGNGGTCAQTGTAIPYNTSGPALINENGNVTLSAGGNMSFVPGTYSCSASGSCFGCGALSIGLEVNGAILHRSTKVLARGQQTGVASIRQVTFTVNAVTPVRVIQFCTPTPDSDPLATELGLGMALPDYSIATKFSDIDCTRIF